jgi:hypothetical protein
VDFEQVLKEVVWRLVTEGRISYRRIKLSFALDDDGLEELRRELIGLKRLPDRPVATLGCVHLTYARYARGGLQSGFRARDGLSPLEGDGLKFRLLVARPSNRHGRRTALEAGADLSGNRRFESISLHQRVWCEPDFLDQGSIASPCATGETRLRARPELKPGTRLVREWQGRTYEVLVLDDGFSWQDTHYRSLSALARKITGTPWSGPLFFGLKPSRSATRRSSQLSGPIGEPTEDSNAVGLT